MPASDWLTEEWQNATIVGIQLGQPAVHFFNHAEFYGLLLLCLNRYTGICLPTRHNKVRRRRPIAAR